jgi:hypothetical protein
MDQKQIFRQMVDFNKGAFNNAFNAMVMVQDQTETLAKFHAEPGHLDARRRPQSYQGVGGRL